MYILSDGFLIYALTALPPYKSFSHQLLERDTHVVTQWVSETEPKIGDVSKMWLTRNH